MSLRCSVITACVLMTLAALAPSASACGPRSESEPLTRVIGDIDGDDEADAVAGVPERGGGAGAVAVRLTTGGRQVLPGASPGDRLGAAVAIGDVNGDGCADIVAGAPGMGGSGAVLVLRGSPAGVATVPVVLPGGAPGDRFGTAVALAARLDGEVDDLWIGAPGADVAGRVDAGAIHHMTFGPGAAVSPPDVLTEDSPDVPDAAEPGDRFGEVLDAVGDGVLIGVPHEDVGNRRDAGAVVLISESATRRRLFPQARAGDHFGAAVASLGASGLAGAPGRDLPGARDAGVVQLFGPHLGGRFAPGDRLAQGVRGLPGRFEPGDRFGAALIAGSSFLCTETSSVAIGAPGEDLGRARDAGSVTIIEPVKFGCRPRALARGHGFPGRPARGDELGGTLTILRAPDELEELAADTLLVGVPGAGEVVQRPPSGEGARPSRTFRFPGAQGRASVLALPAVGDARIGAACSCRSRTGIAAGRRSP
jgi:FG-GAP repeat